MSSVWKLGNCGLFLFWSLSRQVMSIAWKLGKYGLIHSWSLSREVMSSVEAGEVWTDPLLESLQKGDVYIVEAEGVCTYR